MRLWEHVNKLKKDTDALPPDVNSNHFTATVISDVLPPVKSENSTSTWVDLLSGDDIISGPNSQPVPETALHDPFLNPFHDHDKANDLPMVSVQHNVSTESGPQQYISIFRRLTASHVVCYCHDLLNDSIYCITISFPA